MKRAKPLLTVVGYSARPGLGWISAIISRPGLGWISAIISRETDDFVTAKLEEE